MWSKEETIREAKRKAVQRNRRCVVHLEEGRTIPLITDAIKASGREPALQAYVHTRTSMCRFETADAKKARVDRVMALLEDARQTMEAQRAALEALRAVIGARPRMTTPDGPATPSRSISAASGQIPCTHRRDHHGPRSLVRGCGLPTTDPRNPQREKESGAIMSG